MYNKNTGEKMKREKTKCKICSRETAIFVYKNGQKEVMKHTGIGTDSYWAYGRMIRNPSYRPTCFGSYFDPNYTVEETLEHVLAKSKRYRDYEVEQNKKRNYLGDEEKRAKHLRAIHNLFDELDNKFKKKLSL